MSASAEEDIIDAAVWRFDSSFNNNNYNSKNNSWANKNLIFYLAMGMQVRDLPESASD